MLLNCKTGFQAKKKLGKNLVPLKLRSWLKKCVSKMYSILQVKWSQSKAFVLALLDATGEILHTLPNGHRDYFWAFPGANKHGYLLKQICNSKLRQWGTGSQSTSNLTFKYITRYGGKNEQAQVYTKRGDNKQKYSNTEIIEILENVDKGKLSYVPPIKPKGVKSMSWTGKVIRVKSKTMFLTNMCGLQTQLKELNIQIKIFTKIFQYS